MTVIILILILGTKANAQERDVYIEDEEYNIIVEVDNEWENTYQATVTIENKSTDIIKNWLLEIETLDNISEIWNASIEYNDDGMYYIKGEDNNGDIDPGKSVSFSYIARYENIKMFFTDGYIYSETVNLQERDYNVTTTVQAQWGDYSIVDVTLENIGEFDITDWEMSFCTDSIIEEVWEADIESDMEGSYTLSYLPYNKTIATDDSITIQMKVKNNKSFEYTNLHVTAVNWDIKSIIADTDEEDFFEEVQGVELTEKQYSNLSKVFTDDQIQCMTSETLELYKNDETLEVVSEDKVYVKTDHYYLLGNEIRTVDEVITEEEAKQELSRKQTRASASHSTSMKQLTMTIVSGAISSYKQVSLKNTWLKLPSVRSFDVIAIRPITMSLTANTYFDSTISGYQKYKSDGYIRYSYGSDNIKIVTGKGEGKCGIGLSTNLKDDAILLENGLSVTFITGSEIFSAAGTYQHATENITLKKSKKYSFGATGYGGVLIFNDSVKDVYDKMQGVHVTHVLGVN